MAIIPNSSIWINMVTGETKSIGRIYVPITLNSITKPINLHVVSGFKHNLLLGLDAGRAFNITISLRQRTITANHHNTFAVHIKNPSVALPTGCPYPPQGPPPAVTTTSKDLPSLVLTSQGPSDPSSIIKNLLESYSDIFATESNPVGTIPNVHHTIVTTSEVPIYVKPYRKPQTEHDLVRTITTDLTSRGFIRPSHSAYGFPSHVVKKKNGDPRLVIDYRELNKVTVSDKFSIPQIQDVLDRLQGSHYFSTLDMAWGYWHIPMDPVSVPKTAFITQDGHFEWLVMPFGLKNAPSVLQRALRSILGDLSYKCTINYLDDIVVYSKTLEDHIIHLKQVFEKLRSNNIKLRMKKCSFISPSVEFLGFKIHHDSVSPNPDKVKALQEYPTPRSRKQVQRFLGLCSYFRSLIHHFTEIAFPLTQLTKKTTSFTWKEKEKFSFEALKKSLQGPPILKIFDPSLPSELHTDASKVGIGAILVQRNPDGTPRVVSYFSKRLSKEQENWSTTDQEGLAVVEAIEKFDCYLRPFKFSVFTDNSSLTWISNSSKLKGRLLRWFLRLQIYSFDIYHRKGTQNQHVDALSRAPVNEPSKSSTVTTNNQITDNRNMDTGPPTNNQGPQNDLSRPSNHEQVALVIEQSTKINIQGPSNWTLAASVKGVNPNHTLPFTEETLREAQETSDMAHIRAPVIRNGVIHIRDRRKNKRKVVPPSLVNTVLRFYHDNHGHYSNASTSNMISRYYWWPSIGRDIKDYISKCHQCQMFKAPPGLTLGSLQLMPTPNKPYLYLSMDTINMGAAAENTDRKHIQVIIDHNSRFIWTLATKKNDANAAITAFDKVAHLQPKHLITDNGPNFASHKFNSYLKKHKINHILTTAYHPASNGLVERVNKTLLDRLRFLQDSNPKLLWSSLIQDATNIYNKSVHSVTGFTPRYLLDGSEEIPQGAYQMPLELAREEAAIRTAKAQRERKEQYDKKHQFIIFNRGDKVLRIIPKNHPNFNHKLAPKNLGPFVVIKQSGPVNYWIGDSLEDPKPIHVHLDQIAPYQEGSEDLAADSLHLHGGACDGNHPAQGFTGPQDNSQRCLLS